jgi:hypothetical protein
VVRPKAIAGALLLTLTLLNPVWAAPGDGAGFTVEHTFDAISSASSDSGVSYSLMVGIVRCETGGTFNPYIEGDGGHSHGIAQLNDYGNALSAFYAAGYDDPYNPYQAAYFMAEALNGRYKHLGRWTWNC